MSFSSMTRQNCTLALKQDHHHKTVLDHVIPFTIQPRSDPVRLASFMETNLETTRLLWKWKCDSDRHQRTSTDKVCSPLIWGGIKPHKRGRKLMSINKAHAYLYRKCGTKLSDQTPYSVKLTGSNHLQSSSDRFFYSVINAQGLSIWRTSTSFYYFFNNALNSSGCIVLNGSSMTANELGRMWSWVRYYPSLCLEETEEYNK
jgi:hypothetical protein